MGEDGDETCSCSCILIISWIHQVFVNTNWKLKQAHLVSSTMRMTFEWNVWNYSFHYRYLNIHLTITALRIWNKTIQTVIFNVLFMHPLAIIGRARSYPSPLLVFTIALGRGVELPLWRPWTPDKLYFTFGKRCIQTETLTNWVLAVQFMYFIINNSYLLNPP